MLLIPALGLLLLMRSSATEKRNPPPDITDTEALNIVNTGIFALTPDAMGITFYIDLVNNLPVSLDIATRMWECCETFDVGEVDCSHMHLMGGYKGIICPGHSRNVTLFYPNLYVYNRIGVCLVGIWYRDPDGKVKELRTKVNFDTSLSPRHTAPAIEAYYEAETMKARKCAYIDEDPLDRCRPVDCSRKYNGQRVFYSNVDRRCLVAPKCNKPNITRKFDPSAQKMINLPKLVYAPEGNMCEDMEPIIKEEDIRTLNSGRGVDQDLHPSNEYDFIVCHNGNKSFFTGRCTCHEGWSSTTNHIRPTAIKVHLCTVSQYPPKSSFDHALEEIIYSIRQVTPSFIDAIYCLPFYKLPASVLGSVVLLSVCLNAIFTCVYRNEGHSSVGKIYPKKPKETCRKDHQVRRTEVISRDYADTNSDVTSELTISSDLNKFSARRYHDFNDNRNRPNLYMKHHNYSSNKMNQPSTSVGFLTETFPRYNTEDFNATCSMSPQEKLQYLGRLKEQTPHESDPLLLEESQQRSYRFSRNDENSCTNPLRSIPKASETSEVTNLWRNTLALNQHLEARKRIDASRNKRTKRLVDASTLSKSMARLTYSPLPSSDSLLSLEETGTTFTAPDDVH